MSMAARHHKIPFKFYLSSYTRIFGDIFAHNWREAFFTFHMQQYFCLEWKIAKDNMLVYLHLRGIRQLREFLLEKKIQEI